MIRFLMKSAILTLLLFVSTNYAMEVPNNDIQSMPLPPDTVNIILGHLEERERLIDRIQFLSTCKGFYDHGRKLVREKYPHMESLEWHQLSFFSTEESRNFNYLLTIAVMHFRKFSGLLGRSYSQKDLEKHASLLKKSCKLFDSLIQKAQSSRYLDSYQTRGAFAYWTGFNWFEEAQEQPLIPLLHFLRNYAEGKIIYMGEYAGEVTNNRRQDPRRTTKVMLESSPMFQTTDRRYENSLNQYCLRISQLYARSNNKAYPAEHGLHAALFSGWIGQEDCKERDGCKGEHIVVKRPRTGMLYTIGLGGNFVSYFAYEFPDALSGDLHQLCHPHFRGMILSEGYDAPFHKGGR